jgi:regulatory protein
VDVQRKTAPRTPLDRALRLLAARARTSAELDRALARAGVEARERAVALARLRELGYMDDAAVAHGRARSLLERGMAARLAERRLRSQGVGQDAAREAVAEAAEGASERAQLEKALERRLRGRAVRDDKERRRLFRSLVAQGHRPALVAAVLQMGDEVGDDVESDDALDR